MVITQLNLTCQKLSRFLSIIGSFIYFLILVSGTAHALTSSNANQVKEIGLLDMLKYLLPVLVIILGVVQYSIYRRRVDQRKSQKALQASESNLRLSQKSGGIGTWESDLVNNKQSWSENCIDLIGLSTIAEPTWEDFLAIVHPDDRQRVIDATQAHIENGSRYDVEYRVNIEGHGVRWMHSAGQCERDANEKPIFMRGIVQDITERKRAEIQLADNERHFSTLVKLTPVGVFETDCDGKCTYVNERWSEITGISFDLAKGDGWKNALYEADKNKVYDEWISSVSENRPFHLEYRFVRPDESVIWVLGQSTSFQFATGEFGFVGSITDITERKKSEILLIESEAHLRAIIDNEPECIKVVDAEGRLIKMNPAGLAMIEADSQEQVVGHPLLDLIVPEYRRAFAKMHSKVISGKSMKMEFEIIGLKGGRRWLETFAVPMIEKGHSVLLGVTRDITESKRAQFELQTQKLELEMQNQQLKQGQLDLEESRDRYVDLYEFAPIGYLSISSQGMITEVNWKATAMFGLKRNQMLQHRFAQFITDDDKERWHRLFVNMKGLDEGEELSLEMKFTHSNESIFYANLNCLRMDDDLSLPMLRMTLVDSTRLKQAEHAQRQIALKLKATLEAIPDLLFELGLNGRYYDVHTSNNELLAAPSDTLIGKTVQEVLPPEAAATVMSALREANETGRSQGKQFELLVQEGLMWFELSVAKKSTNEDVSPRFIVLSRNITERKQAETELAKNRDYLKVQENSLRTLVENTPDTLVRYDHSCRRTYANKALLQELVKSMDEVIGKTPIESSGESESIKLYQEKIQEVFEKGQKDKFLLEWPNSTGEIVYTDVRLIPEFDLEGKVISVLGIGQNITERKHAETELIKSERHSRAVIESSPVPIALNDDFGNITYLNGAFVKLIGYTVEDIPTLSDWWPLAYPDLQYRQQVADKWQINLEDAKHTSKPFKPMEINIQCKDGSIRTFIASAAALGEGFSETHIVTLYDITERNKAEVKIAKSQHFLTTVINNAPIRVFWKDQNLRYLGCNTAFAKDAGLASPEDIIGKDDFQMGWAEQAELYRVDDRAIMETGIGKLSYDEPQSTQDGQQIWIRTSKVPLKDENNNALGILGIYEDITERKLAENELRVAATAFESIEGMIVTDPNMVILRVNRTFTTISGYTAEEAVGQTPRLINSGYHDDDFYAAMWRTINDTGAWEGEVWNRRKSGDVYPQHLIITAVKDEEGVIMNYVASMTDVTKSKAAEVEIHNLAFYDPLTHLPNRRLFVDRLNHALAASGRMGWRGALLYLDLDHFKVINDTRGHDVGDLLLQQVAERLASSVREGDTVARMGGDEFVVMLEDLSQQAIEAATQAETIANKIQATLSQPYQLASQRYRSTASIGVALFSGHAQSQEDLLKHADIAMYQAKKAGRNTLRFFDPEMQETINARVLLEDELRKALKKRQFQLHYQIQVNQLGQPLGAEALIRWVHPDRGLLTPIHFIPLAEETGLILPIGEWVLDTACAQLKVWEGDKFTRDLTLSVNVSANQFHQSDFVGQVQVAIQRHAIDPTKLKLELTESMLLDSIEETILSMITLESIGVKFSLDDFGTGYSSLQYLKLLPLNQLKIDQSFVRDIVTDRSDQAIVRTIIAMAHSLEVDVIAEGVETEEQRELLLNNDCIRYQGYLFGKPIPIDQFEAALKPKVTEKIKGRK